MKFECYTSWDQLPKSAEPLFERGAQASIFLSRAWFVNLANHAKSDDQSLILACVVKQNSVLAVLPLFKSSSQCWASLSAIYTSLYSFLLVDDDQTNVIACLVKGLKKLPFKSLSLEPISADDAHCIKLKKTMALEGFCVLQNFRFYNWVNELKGQTFDDYMQQRPNVVRNTVGRKTRKLEREHGFTIKLYTDENLQTAIDDYNVVYTQSWKANERLINFTQELINSMAQQGWLRFAVLYVKDKPIAAQIWFVVHKKTSIYRLVYDEAWKQYSPGSILTVYLMKHVIDFDNVIEIDFLTGNERYKQDWMTQRRERFELVFYKKPKPKSFMQKLLSGWR